MRPLRTLAADSRGGALRPETKRKLPQQQPTAGGGSGENSGVLSHTRQSTISELFSPSQPKLDPSGADSPPTKRLKSARCSKELVSGSHRGESTSDLKMAQPSLAASPQHSVIDLTSSPSSSPAVRNSGTSTYDGVRRSSNFQPYTGAKRLIIKNLRQTPRTSPEELLERTWTQLGAALTAIFGGEKLPNSLEELYRGVENVCRHQGAPELFQRLKSRCQIHIRTTVREQLVQVAEGGARTVDPLRAVHDAWMRWNGQVLTIRSIFYYMDRSYLLPSNIHPTIDEMSTSQFRTHVFSDPRIEPKILGAMYDLVQNERKGLHDLTESSLLKEAVRMTHDLFVYTSKFEPVLLSASKRFFDLWAQKESSECDLATYVISCGDLIEAEMVRCDTFNLDTSTRREIIAILEDLLLRQKIDVLVRTEPISKLFDAHDLKVLSLLYSLLLRVDLHNKLRDPWEKYIKSTGSSIIRDQQRESEMVVGLLGLRLKVDSIWETAFRKHEKLGHALREAFGSFINERRSSAGGNLSDSKPGEMIAKYIDMLLRGGAKAIAATPSSKERDIGVADEYDPDAVTGDDDAELGRQLDRVLELFRFIEGKDVFEAFYKKDLARRLLMGRSASADAERNMLARLKNECGSSFTHNLEQMFKDIDLARDEMASYKQMREERGNSDELDLSVNVLSSSAWPSYPDVPVNIPSNIMNAIDRYDQHYKVKHTGRGLNWKHSLAHCVVRARFPRGNKELVVSSFQAIVMLLFNEIADKQCLSYREIQDATGLSDVELMRTLQSLACAKFRVLNKIPKGREVNKDDKFSVNSNFAEAKYRIKINQIQLKETKEENKATHEDVNRDRQYEAQAAIVRIMKSRKTISAPELMVETINSTKQRGALDTAEIKKQIDKLIEKDYLERTVENGRMVYSYLA